MAIREWFVLAVVCAAGVIGLLLAASNGGGAIYHVGLILFVVAVVYAFVFVKQHFDRIDQAPH